MSSSRPWRGLVVGQSLSLSGAYAQTVALGWLAFAAGGPSGVATAAAARFAPCLAAPFVGRVLDRVDRRRWLRINTVWQIAFTTAFAVLLFRDVTLTVKVVAAFAFVYGLGGTVDACCATAVICDRAGTEHAGTAVTELAAGGNIARVAGSAFAGLLLTGVGAAAVFAYNAGSFVALAVALRPRIGDGHPKQITAAADVQPPARWWAVPTLAPLTGAFVVFCAVAFQPAVLIPIVGATLAGGGGVAALNTAGAVGTVIASVTLVARRRRADWRQARFGYLACAAALGLFAVPALVVGVAAAALFGATVTLVTTTTTAAVAATVAADQRASAMAWYRLLVDGLTPVGGFAVAVAANTGGVPAAAGWCAAGAVAAFVFGSWLHRRDNSGSTVGTVQFSRTGAQ